MAQWNLTNDSGENVASGIYLYLVTVNDAVYGSSRKATGQIVVIR